MGRVEDKGDEVRHMGDHDIVLYSTTAGPLVELQYYSTGTGVLSATATDVPVACTPYYRC